MTTLAALGLLAVVQTASANTQQPTDSLQTEHVVGELGEKLDSQLTRYAAEKGGFSGTVLVVRDRRIVLLKGYGLANIETKTPNTPATRFEMNSMTKMLTAVSILQLFAAGRLQLDDRVERYLGDFPAGKRGATVLHLAMHTSGLIVAGTELAGETRDAFVTDVKRTARESPPGTKYRYTNAGYSLLAAIIELVSGASYESYLKMNAFAPAGMSSATFRDEVPSANPLFAHGYVGGADGAPKPGPPNPYVWGTRGAGGVWSTVGDMYRWLVAVEDSVVVGGPLRMLLFAPPGPPSLEAFGWHVRLATDSTRALIDKGGGSDDFASQLLYFPRERVAIIWASNNLTRRWRQTLNRAIPDLIFAGATKPLVSAYTCQPSDFYSDMMIRQINSSIADTASRRALGLPNVPSSQVTLATDAALCNRAGLALDSLANSQHPNEPRPPQGTRAFYVLKIGTYTGISLLDSTLTKRSYAPLFLFDPIWQFVSIIGL